MKIAALFTLTIVIFTGCGGVHHQNLGGISYEETNLSLLNPSRGPESMGLATIYMAEAGRITAEAGLITAYANDPKKFGGTTSPVSLSMGSESGRYKIIFVNDTPTKILRIGASETNGLKTIVRHAYGAKFYLNNRRFEYTVYTEKGGFYKAGRKTIPNDGIRVPYIDGELYDMIINIQKPS